MEKKKYSDYATFSTSRSTVETDGAKHYAGLETKAARQQLVDQVMKMHMHIDKKRGIDIIWSNQPVASVIFICTILRVASISIVHRDLVQQTIEILILLSTCICHILLSRLETQRREVQVFERVKYTLQAMLNRDKDPDAAISSRILLSPSPSYIAVYRDSMWQRIPSNLLVKDDIIALVTGDTVPGDVEVLWPHKTSELLLSRGTSVPRPIDDDNDDHRRRRQQRQTATFDPELLLSLCGNMRIYKMLETPVLQDLRLSISKLHTKPISRLHKQTVYAYRIAQHYSLGFVIVLFIALVTRLWLFSPPTWAFSLHHFLRCPVDLILCFTPLSSPVLFLICEAGGISRLLATVESLKHRDCAAVSSPTAAADEMDQLDVEERTDARSKRRHGFTTRRSWKYFFTTLRYRLMSTPSAHRTIESDMTESIPYLSCHLLETLGAVTMLCILDDQVVCEPEPTVSELYLIEENEVSSVLDLHHEQYGLKFEDVHWKRHLSCLKPIGLGIMVHTNGLTYSREYYNQLVASSSPSAAPASSVEQLTAHVRQLPIPEYLLQLATEIGFCQADLECFLKCQSLHVVEPQLADEEHTNDTHAQGQQDLRLRGNLKSHLVSNVILDQRSKSLQLLTQGHPCLLLKRCRQYWNGKSICPLTDSIRQSILDMYHQWMVENMDCMAFSYAPVSQKYQPLFAQEESQKIKELPPIFLVEGRQGGADGGNGTHHDEMAEEKGKDSSMGIPTSTEKTHDEDAAYWEIQENQIFLGMTASAVHPKKQVSGFIEDLTAAGIRFVYFSPRNMKRSKDFAEKIGIETDWNCAISLRPLEVDQSVDPHRMTSNYSDWDVKARLPHGVDAIRQHLEHVDNVPLLVSLYTDSTTDSIREMISIFQQHDEVVLCVGTSLNEQNTTLFTHADVAIAMDTQPCVFFNDTVPDASQTFVLNESDLLLSRILNTLTCSITFSGSLDAIVDLIRLGREIMTNYQQQLVFTMSAQVFLATIILIGQCIPLPQSTEFKGLSLLWFLWIVIPSISLSMIATPSDRHSMTRTPEKNTTTTPIEQPISRYAWYFIIRFGPSALVSVLGYEYVLGQALVQSGAAESNSTWWGAITTRDMFLLGYRDQEQSQLVAESLAEAYLMLFVTICICTSSISMLYRSESIAVEYPFRNKVWVMTTAVILALQVGLWRLKVSSTGIVMVLPWYFWLGFALWPVVVLAIDESVKLNDRRILLRYYKFLRMQFDTRLGMWSPK